jgi:hypothetical protein
MALVGIKEVAQMLGVSRTRADQLSRRPNFPEPKVRHARPALGKARRPGVDQRKPQTTRLTLTGTPRIPGSMCRAPYDWWLVDGDEIASAESDLPLHDLLLQPADDI